MKNSDKKYFSNKIKIIAGTDEAGRGPLAGPVVAAAVILPKDFYDERIDDSKKLSAALRQLLFSVIKKNALCYAYTIISQNKIDQINILKASLTDLPRTRSITYLTLRGDILAYL